MVDGLVAGRHRLGVPVQILQQRAPVHLAHGHVLAVAGQGGEIRGQFFLDGQGLLLRGQSNKLIARELDLSVETVKDHVAAVLRALGVNSRTQAVLAVSQMSSQGAIAPWLTRPLL